MDLVSGRKLLIRKMNHESAECPRDGNRLLKSVILFSSDAGLSFDSKRALGRSRWDRPGERSEIRVDRAQPEISSPSAGIAPPKGGRTIEGRYRGMSKRRNGTQTTLRNRATLSGVGVHSGQVVSMTLHPAEADSGVCFYRTNLDDGRDREIPADYRYVSGTDLCTAVGVAGTSVATIEHLMATLRALDVDNCMIEIDGPEVPVMDGSAEAFIDAVDQAGIETLSAMRRYIRVEKPIRVEMGSSFAEFRPHDGRRIEVEIDFANPLIGRQRFAAEINAGTFRDEIARARTFGFLSDVRSLWARGFALGASLDNAVVIAEDRVMNPEGLRFEDEFVRHKALDAVGDIALARAPILGCYRSYRGGHRLNVMALEALVADREAWSYVEMPARRETGHADLPAGVGVAAFGPDVS